MTTPTSMMHTPVMHTQSWIHGKMVQAFEPAAVALSTSHGYETPSSKMLMRVTVLLSDALGRYASSCWAHVPWRGSSTHRTWREHETCCLAWTAGGCLWFYSSKAAGAHAVRWVR